jgi:hypothetical protein
VNEEANAALDPLVAVLLEEPRLVDVARAAETLRPLYPDLAPIDVRQRCRYAAGVIEEAVSLERGRELVEALRGAGIEACLRHAEAVPFLAVPVTIRSVAFSEATVALTPSSGAAITLSADAIDLILLFALDAPRPRREGLSADAGAAKRAGDEGVLGEVADRLAYTLARFRKREQRDARLMIDVVSGHAVYRLERHETTWPAGPRQHSLEHYLGIARALLERAPHAGGLPENEHLLAGRLDPACFSHPEEVWRYERQHLARRAPSLEGPVY